MVEGISADFAATGHKLHELFFAHSLQNRLLLLAQPGWFREMWQMAIHASIILATIVVVVDARLLAEFLGSAPRAKLIPERQILRPKMKHSKIKASR